MNSLSKTLAVMDCRFGLALDELEDAYHWGAKGARYEDSVVDLLSKLVPFPYQVGAGLLSADTAEDRKQVDFVVHPPLPAVVLQGSATLLHPEWIFVAGEIKTNLSNREDILSTAKKLDRFAERSANGKLPFAILAGEIKRSPEWLRNLVAQISDECTHIWPAAFVFGSGGTSSIALGDQAPLVAFDVNETSVMGTATIPGETLSPAAVLYLWVWAALQKVSVVPTMDYGYMNLAIQDLTSATPLRVEVRNGGIDSIATDVKLEMANFARRERGILAQSEVAADFSRLLPTVKDSGDPLASPLKLMLISLGEWVDEYESWDETPWGGVVESRTGYGYRAGMTTVELLKAARVFWRFNPSTPTWQGIEYAVVAHAGITRAVIKIDRFIGPFWGRYGFQGHVVVDAELVDQLVGKAVDTRQNPVTTWRPTV